jgi:predicted PurR-regulated permease PerM
MAFIAAVVGLLAWQLASVWLLLFAATLFGLGLRTASTWLSERTHMPRWTALVLWIILGAAMIGGFFWFVAASLISQFADLSDRIPRALESLRDWASGYSFLEPITRDVEALLGGNGDGVGPSAFLGGALDASRLTITALGNVVVMCVLAIYMALDVKTYASGILRLVPPDWRDTATELLEAWSTALPWWLAARIMSMTLVAILVSIGLAIAGVPLALVLGLIAGLFSFVPFLGPIASVVPAILVGLTESSSTVLSVLIVFGAVQILESYLITPLIERRTVSIPLFPLIAAQLVAGALLGVPGVMFATPMFLTLAIAIQVVYQRRILGEEVEIWGVG